MLTDEPTTTGISTTPPGADSEGEGERGRATKPLAILCIAQSGQGTGSLQRTQALRRLGHHVTVVDPFEFGPKSLRARAVDYKTGYRFTRWLVARRLLQHLGGARFDLVWVQGGVQIGPDLVRSLRSQARAVVNYNNDDPYGGRDGRRFDTYRAAVPEYDKVYVLRNQNVAESYAAGARAVERLWFAYDDVAHRADPLTVEERQTWASDVLFVGTYMPERGPFMAELIRRGVPLSIWGDRWDRAPEWETIKPAWRGPGLFSDDYSRALRGAKICLGLVSKGNRDQHTIRSVEIPAVGTLLCAERTAEHQALYKEDSEAVFWGSAEECAGVCERLLASPERIEQIAAAGHARVRSLRLSHEQMLADAIGRLELV